MVLLDTLKAGIRMLERKGFKDARVSSEALLSHVIQNPRFKIYTDSNFKISARAQNRFFELVQKRAKYEPLQYLIGSVPFYNVQVKVRKGTLIPRSETEILVEAALSHIRENKIINPRILDVGTGSGCIAVSLAKEYSGAQIWATDISKRSLKLASENAKDNYVESRICFEKANFWPRNLRNFDLIVSNPPYLTAKDFKHLQPELAFEPKRALFGGRDGLTCYQFMIGHAKEILKPGGVMIFEVGLGQAKPVKKMFQENNFNSVKIAKDLSGIDRVVSATLTQH